MAPASRVRIVKLAGEQRYLARSRTLEPGSYWELRVTSLGHVRCSCPGFGFRGRCAHAQALTERLGGPTREDLLSRIKRTHA